MSKNAETTSGMIVVIGEVNTKETWEPNCMFVDPARQESRLHRATREILGFANGIVADGSPVDTVTKLGVASVAPSHESVTKEAALAHTDTMQSVLENILNGKKQVEKLQPPEDNPSYGAILEYLEGEMSPNDVGLYFLLESLRRARDFYTIVQQSSLNNRLIGVHSPNPLGTRMDLGGRLLAHLLRTTPDISD